MTIHTSSARDEVQRAVLARWTEIAYNRKCLHTSLGIVPPVEFEDSLQLLRHRDD